METCVLTHGLRATFDAAKGPSVPFLFKRAGRKPIRAVHPMARPAIKRARANMAHVIHAFFVHQAPKVIGQIIALRGRQHFVKSSLTSEDIDALNKLMDEIQFGGWAILAGDVEDVLAQAVNDGGVASLASMGLDTTADSSFMNVVNQEALDYSASRSAEMVGMREDAAGNLIPNPDARWQITEPTRDFLRGDVREAMEKGWSNDVLAEKLAQNYAFSDARAMMISRTETIRASNQGALASYTAAGVEEKEWTTAEDDRVSEDCEANGEQGPIPIDEDFDSGDDAPPAHPNCRCVIVPVVHFASDEPQAEDTTAETDAGDGETVDTADTSTAETAQEAEATVAASEAVVVEDVAPAAIERDMPDVIWHGDPSQSFRDIVENFMATKLGDGVMSTLADKVDFEFGDRLTQMRPELKGVHPRGWPPGATWDSAEGLFESGYNAASFENAVSREGAILTSETFRPFGSGSKGAFVTSNRIAGVLAHETGHGLDYALDWISKSDEFRKAYNADAKALRAYKKDIPQSRRWNYYLQKRDAGPKEAFAEIFGQVVNDGKASSMYDERQWFPNVTQFIEDLVAKLEADFEAGVPDE